MIRIYVAGPISRGNMLQNCIRGMKVAHQLLKLGYVPFCPHQSWIWQQVTPLTHNEWLEYDFRWLEMCDAVLRMPGESFGADMEIRFAEERKIPVYYSIKEILKKLPILKKQIEFEKSVRWFLLEPHVAMKLGQNLIHHAKKIKAKSVQKIKKSKKTEVCYGTK